MIGVLMMAAVLSQSPAGGGMSVELTVQAARPNLDSKVIGSLVLTDVRRPTLLYVHAPKTLCEGITIGPDKPASAAYGWSVEVVPVRNAAQIKWSRLWFNGAPTRANLGAKGLKLDDPAWVSRAVLDRIDDESKTPIARRLQTLKSVDPGSAEADRLPEIISDPGVSARQAAIEDVERRLAHALTRIGERHPDILKLRAELQMLRAQAVARKAQVLEGLIGEYERLTLPSAFQGCDFLSAALVANLTKPAAAKVVEADVWFVHKTPDGKEATQRQTVRVRDGGRGDFYFDDLRLTANVGGEKAPTTLEVFGTLDNISMMGNGDVRMSLHVTRRLINPNAAGLGIPPRIGRGEYPITVSPGEVVSFVLPPLEDDGGSFLGHRFSVRMRISPVREN